MPVVAAVSFARLIALLMKYGIANFPLKSFLSMLALIIVSHAGLVATCFLGSLVIRLRAKVLSYAVSYLLYFCAALLFVASVESYSQSHSSFEIAEPDPTLKSQIHGFFADTFLSEVPVKLVKSAWVNASAGADIIYIENGLIRELNPAEINGVMAHEASHLYHEDAEMGVALLLLAFIIILSIFAVFTSCKRFSCKCSLQSKDFTQNFCVVLMVSLLCVPFAKIAWTQYKRIREVRADAEAVQYLIYKNASIRDFENALLKTGKNLPEPTFLTNLLMFDHPSTQDRIENIRVTELEIGQLHNALPVE
jgi:Zn-dependent protease with chaperone function